MGSGSSTVDEKNGSMYGGGHPRTSQNPRSRGPRSFEELDEFASPSGSPGPQSHRAQDTTRSENLPPVGNAKKMNQTTGKGHSSQCDDDADGDLVFETFHHRNNKDYTCMRLAGERFVMNEHNIGEWLPFPPEWYDQGIFVTNNVLKDGDLDQETLMQIVYEGADLDNVVWQNNNGAKNTSSGVTTASTDNDDRYGQIRHPVKGVISTYMFEEKRNVHCYFDENSGEWVKLPLSWELHSDYVKSLIAQLSRGIPQWTDRFDMLASLRASNYDVDDCEATWLTIGDQSSMTAPRNAKDQQLIATKDSKIRDLEAQLLHMSHNNSKLQQQLSIALKDIETCKKTNTILQDKLVDLEVTNNVASVELKSLYSQLAHYKEVISQQQQLALDTAKQEKLEAERKAIDLNDKIKDLYAANKLTKEELEGLKQEAALANRRAEEIAQRAEETKQMAQMEAKKQQEIALLSKSSDQKRLLKLVADNTKLVHQSYYRMKLQVQQGFDEFSNLLTVAVESSMKLSKLSDMRPPDNVVPIEKLEELRALYRKECLQRKLLYNQLQELRGNIRVYARCRKDMRVECVLSFPSDEDIAVADQKGNVKTFRFDKVYSPDSTQEEVFEETCPIVTSCVDGYNVCILAYGQTGSGKTYTMMGPPNNPGVNIRAIQELLKVTNERTNIDYTLSVSMVEIYNEVTQDLLTKDCKVVNVQLVGNTVNIQGLTTHIVSTQNDITDYMEMGMANRTVAATKMNSESSRSHLLVMLTVEGRDKTSNAKSKSTLTLVDLAGSERVSKTEASGQRLVEAAAINKSLSSLGQVFAALGRSALHIPFRNCKLTQILQPSLSGDAKAALFIALSPAESNLSETISTLTFGSNAKQIELGQAKKNVVKSTKK